MRIGVYANVCGESASGGLDRLIGYCGGIGVREVGLPCRMVVGFQERGYVEAKALEEMKKRLEDGGLKVGMADFFPRTEEEKDPDRLCRTIAALGEAGIDTFNFFVTDNVPLVAQGFSPAVVGADLKVCATTRRGEEESKRREGWERIVRLYERMVQTAENSKVRIGTHIYPEPSRFVCNCEALRRLLSEVESEYNGVTMCLGSCYQTGDDPYQDIRLFGEKIFFVHARQIRKVGEEVSDARLDDGDVDMGRAMQELKDVGFTGMICAEHLPPVAGQEHGEISQALAVGYLRGILEGLR